MRRARRDGPPGGNELEGLNLTEHLVALALLCAARPGGREQIALALRAALETVERPPVQFITLGASAAQARALDDLAENLGMAAESASFLATQAAKVIGRPRP